METPRDPRDYETVCAGRLTMCADAIHEFTRTGQKKWHKEIERFSPDERIQASMFLARLGFESPHARPLKGGLET